MGNTSSSARRGQRYQQRAGKPTSAYSRYSGGGMGSYTSCGQGGNGGRQGGNGGHDKSVYIGRKRLTEQFPHRFRVREITVPRLGQLLVQTCGNEGQHPYLSEAGKATLKFLRASITFVPFALDAGADMRNASFLFAQPGREFAIVAGKGDWEFCFSQNSDGDIFGHCVRKPRLRYIWDGVKSTVRRVGSFLLPIVGPPLLALMAA